MENEYYELGFDERNNDQQNIAEDEGWKHFTNAPDWRIARWGFNEKENYKNGFAGKWWYCLPKVITKSPDGVVVHKDTKKGKIVYLPYFLEIKAVGKSSLKLKKEDLHYMDIWRKTKGMAGIILWTWSCDLQEWYSGTYWYWTNLINDIKPEVKKYHDNEKEYYDLPVDRIF